MYKGLGRPVAISSCKYVGIDIGGRGMDAGFGDGGAGSTGSALPLLGGLEFADGALLRPSRSSGGGREALMGASGLKEFLRVGNDCAGCWKLDLRRLVGGVDSVLDPPKLGRPVLRTRGWVPSDLKGSAFSEPVGCIDWSFSAIDGRMLVSA